MQKRGIQPFVPRRESRGTIREQSVGGGHKYVEWLEDEPKRRLAALVARPDIQTRTEPQEPKEPTGE